MQQFAVRKTSLVLLVFVLMMTGFMTSVVNAEDNVFYCLENKDKCTEDGTPIDEKKDSKDEGPIAEKTDDKGSKAGLSAWDYIQTIFALIFVVGLLFALLKFVNRKNRIYDKNRFMKNMGGISLGQHKSIQLVAVGETYYLIGVGEDIRLLKEITDADEIEKLMEHYEAVDMSSATGLLEQMLTKIPKLKKNSKQQEEATTDFSKIFNHRLDEIKEDRKRHISQLTEKERDHDD